MIELPTSKPHVIDDYEDKQLGLETSEGSSKKVRLSKNTIHFVSVTSGLLVGKKAFIRMNVGIRLPLLFSELPNNLYILIV